MTEVVKTCVTCIFKSGSACTKQWRELPRIDPVSGRKLSGEHWQCSTQRIFSSDCGPKGRWWRPITPTNIYPQGEQNEPNIFHRAALRVLGVFRD